jgi:iron(III) transport system substrate-binding protein
VLETVFVSSTQRTMYNLSLSTYEDNSLNRIKLGPGLMVFLDQFKKQKFLEEWENAILQTEKR